MKKVHVVPHVHWDREWYFSAEESKILLVNDLREVLDFMEAHPEYPNYILDGQTSIIDDFARLAPDDMPRFKKLVEAGRLVVGPWYTQTDEMVVGGESIVRNLYYGLKDAKKFGDPMMIGYLPDSFGQSAQMPQILNGFGITRSLFWRGISERHGTDKTEFVWEGAGNSKVTTQLFPLGYAIGKYLPTDPEALQSRMDKYFTVLDHGATTENVILPNGHDQMPIQKNIYEVLEELKKLYPEREFFLSRYENVFEELEKTDLPKISGEFIDGKYSRVHRSIYSMRSDLKSANTRIENKITNTLEPLMAIAFSLGFDYQAGTIETIWKDLMENHAHDSMGACCSDKVHREIVARLRSVEERVDRLIEFYERKITEGTPDRPDSDKLVVFNTFQQSRKAVITCQIISKLKDFQIHDAHGKEIAYDILHQEIIDPGLIDRQIVHYGNYDPFIAYQIQLERELPAVGYETLYISAGKGKQRSETSTQNSLIENEFYQITSNDDGTINLLVKKSNQMYEGLLALENVADDGDEYDFSPLADDKPLLSSDQVKADSHFTFSGTTQSLVLTYLWQLPKNLTSRKEGVLDGKLAVSIKITLQANEPVVGLQVKFNNEIDDQRTRILLPSAIASAFSIADNQFGQIKRPVVDAAFDIWKKDDWDERPDSIYPFLSHVALADEQSTVGVVTNSVREYEIIGEAFDTLAITLFRGVGFLGKEELLRRPGRPSGIKMATPDSQMHGELVFDLGLLIGTSEELSALPLIAKRFLTPIQTYNQIPYNAMKLNKEKIQSPTEFSLCEIDGKEVLVSTIKVSENQTGILARVYNVNDHEVTLADAQGIQLLNLDESAKETVDEVVIQENEVVSIMIEGREQ